MADTTTTGTGAGTGTGSTSLTTSIKEMAAKNPAAVYGGAGFAVGLLTGYLVWGKKKKSGGGKGMNGTPDKPKKPSMKEQLAEANHKLELANARAQKANAKLKELPAKKGKAA